MTSQALLGIYSLMKAFSTASNLVNKDNGLIKDGPKSDVANCPAYRLTTLTSHTVTVAEWIVDQRLLEVADIAVISVDS